jgi:hypothetical protein
VLPLRSIPIPITIAMLVWLPAMAGCSRGDTAPAVATVSFSTNKDKVPLGSPVELTYRFDVAPNAAITENYRVFVHVLDDRGAEMWNDDHDPPTPTSQWRPGQRVQYTHTRFVPVFPYVGEAVIQVGLHRGNDRLPLQGPNPEDRDSATREYRVGTLTFLPSSENIAFFYKSGWHPAEFASDNPLVEWQWTQKIATLALPRNPRKDVTFYLSYSGRADLFGDAPQQVSVYVGDQVVDTFRVTDNKQTLRTIPISAAQLGAADAVEVRLEVDKTFVPAKLASAGRDSRELGIQVYHQFFEAR